MVNGKGLSGISTAELATAGVFAAFSGLLGSSLVTERSMATSVEAEAPVASSMGSISDGGAAISTNSVMDSTVSIISDTADSDAGSSGSTLTVSEDDAQAATAPAPDSPAPGLTREQMMQEVVGVVKDGIIWAAEIDEATNTSTFSYVAEPGPIGVARIRVLGPFTESECLWICQRLRGAVPTAP